MRTAPIESPTAGADAPFDDPAMRAAPLALRKSAACAVDPATGESCAWYHGIRLYVRGLRLGVDNAAGDLGALFADPLRECAGASGFDRVLVSGTADYAMPAIVAAAYAESSAPLDLTVLDRCPTPLWLTSWYAAEHGFAVRTECRDVLEYASESLFDVVCADQFVAQFPECQRTALAGAWCRLLRPGGRLVTTVRIGPPGEARSRTGKFADLVEVARRASAPGIAPDELAAAVRVYAERPKPRFPIGSADEVVALLERNGFQIVGMEKARPDTAVAGAGTVGFPGIRIVAERDP